MGSGGGWLGVSKRDYEQAKELGLEVSSVKAAIKASGAPSNVLSRVRKITRGHGEEQLDVTWLALNEAGFPALFTPSATTAGTKPIKLSTLFSDPGSLPFVQQFLERYDYLRERAQRPRTDVVGVVFRWPGVQSSMILRDGKAPPESTIAIRIQGSLRFVEPLNVFAARRSTENPWWENF